MLSTSVIYLGNTCKIQVEEFSFIGLIVYNQAIGLFVCVEILWPN